MFEELRNKKVLVTGHTGFKGSWLISWLIKIGAKVIGFSSKKYDNDYIFEHSKILKENIIDERGDISNLSEIKEIFSKYKPEIIFHLAAQPLVRKSYDEPLETIRTNILGTSNVLECIKESTSTKVGIIITTDKVYKNKEQKKGYIEEDEIWGYDPYSVSKACAEMIIDSYNKSFFQHQNKYITSVRAGNVIGGGDFSQDRLIPDCIKKIESNKTIEIRNPNAVRPWQHVIEPLSGYLELASKLIGKNKEFVGSWNFGPEKESNISVKEIVEKIIQNYKGKWKDIFIEDNKHETMFLSLDINKAKKRLEWKPLLNMEQTIKLTVDWYKKREGKDCYNLCEEQIEEYEKRKEYA